MFFNVESSDRYLLFELKFGSKIHCGYHNNWCYFDPLSCWLEYIFLEKSPFSWVHASEHFCSSCKANTYDLFLFFSWHESKSNRERKSKIKEEIKMKNTKAKRKRVREVCEKYLFYKSCSVTSLYYCLARYFCRQKLPDKKKSGFFDSSIHCLVKNIFFHFFWDFCQKSSPYVSDISVSSQKMNCYIYKGKILLMKNWKMVWLNSDYSSVLLWYSYCEEFIHKFKKVSSLYGGILILHSANFQCNFCISGADLYTFIGDYFSYFVRYPLPSKNKFQNSLSHKNHPRTLLVDDQQNEGKKILFFLKSKIMNSLFHIFFILSIHTENNLQL